MLRVRRIVFRTVNTVPLVPPAPHVISVTRHDSASADNLPPRWSARTIALAWTLPSLLAAIYSVVMLRMSGTPFDVRIVAGGIASWYVWAFMTPVIARLAERWRVRRPIDVRRVALHIAAGVAAIAVQATTITIGTLLMPHSADPLSRVFVFWFVTLLPAGICVYAAVVGIRTAELYHADALARTRVAEQLAAQLEKAELSALKAQLQPHFLFNTLNAVIALVRARENEVAAEALMTLSDLLRATLRTSAATEVRLEEELDFTRQYLGIERLRFGDRLTVQLDDANGLGDMMVPTFLLQPFVENAIKHGLRDRREGGVIAVSFGRDDTHLRVQVADNGVGMPDDVADRAPGGGGGGTGLANARARLDHMYGGHASLRLGTPSTGTGTVVDITLPLKPSPAATRAS